MTDDSSKLPYAIALTTSTILWLSTSAVSGKAEPWDASSYWTVAYPLAIGLAGVLGYFFPVRPWRWAIAVMLSQLAVMAFSGSGLGLLPLGMILLLILSVPAILLAGFAARLRRRSDY